MKRIKLIVLSLSLVLVSTFVFVGAANASSFKTGDLVTVAAGETVDSALFVAGNNINIAGTVYGDVYCAGQTVTISGTVNGDVICGGGVIIISGKVDGSVRLAAQTVTISGTIGNSATVGASDLIVEGNASISRDLLGGTANIIINGTIGRDIVSGSGNMTINGIVGRNINSDVETLSIGATGIVGGNVDYTATNEIAISDGGKISGTVSRTISDQDSQSAKSSFDAFSFGWSVFMIFAYLLIALIVAIFLPKSLNSASANTIKTPGKIVLKGLVASILVPISIIILFVTIIGAPLAILVLLAWIIISMLSGSFAGYALGKKLFPKLKQPIAIILSGVSVISVVSLIPVPIISFAASAASYLFGTGMIISEIKNLRSTAKKATISHKSKI